ncbi:uncharacterized protein LOC113385853 [Ctenocephalides felis]|uniref:uncharacterized protein LOC113385853 n=1 Tax=Ctenocephalides felis TaxID=7515 RepID=UPI000E6E4F4C|nr:uncharacterized protein LOC113385853 [Ctenocephalides felis]
MPQSKRRASFTVRGSAHWPCDYPGGPTIFGRSELTSRLSWRGRNDAYDYGVEIGEMYKEKFNIEQWNKTKYLSLASSSPRTQQAALVLAAGLENKRYKKDRIWSSEKKKTTQFPGMQEYLKFYSKEQCPRFLQEVEKNYPKTDRELELLKAIVILKKKLAQKTTSIRTPHDIWLAYESLYNVFYSYRKKYHNKMKYWRQIRNELKQYSKQFMWSSLTADNTLRKLASGPIVFDVLRDIKYIRDNHTENNKPVPKKIELEPKNNEPAPKKHEHVLSILTVPQGVFAALVAGFAPNGTTVDGKLFDADDLYPKHGAMHIIELYHVTADKWHVKILYRKKKGDCLKPLRLPGCNKEGKLPPNFCTLKQIKEAVNRTSLGPIKHSNLCTQTVRGPAHWPCDYPGGPTIFGRSEFTSRLSWRGRNDAYDYGVEIGKMYKEKFGIKKWTKDKYWSFASGSPRTQQAALVLAAVLENKRYKKDRIWSIAKKNTTQFPAMQEYTKFYSAEKCPRFFQELEVKYPIIKDEVIKAIAVLKEKIVPKRTAIQTPQDIWLAYESLYNVFYSYRKKKLSQNEVLETNSKRT